MTNEEAIKQIKTARADFEWEYPYRDTTGFDMAIKALEDEAVLDKIRAEIIERDRAIKTVRSDSCCFFTAEEVLEIIDKYMAESEDKNEL